MQGREGPLTVAVPVAQDEGVELGQVDVQGLNVAADAEAFGARVEQNLELLIAYRRLLSPSAYRGVPCSSR